MTDWQSGPRDEFSETPFAQWDVSQKHQKSTKFILFFLVGFGLFGLIVIVGGMYWFVQRAASTTPSAPVETLEERIRATNRAYSSTSVGVDTATARQLQQLLDAVESAAREMDDEAFAKLVNFERLTAYVVQSGDLSSYGALRKLMVRRQLPELIYVDPNWLGIKLRYVEQVEGTDQAILYTHCDNESWQGDVRFWVTHQQQQWKVADWQYMDLGLRESATISLYFVYAEDPRLTRYFETLEELRSDLFTRALNRQEKTRAKLTLRDIEQRSILPAFRDLLFVRLSEEWLWLDEPKEALRCCDQVGNPDEACGAHRVRAQALAHMGRYEEAIEVANTYERVLGATPVVCSCKASWLRELGRYEEAVDQWKKLLRADPDDWSALWMLAQHLTESELDSLVPLLMRAADPRERCEQIANSLVGARQAAVLGYLMKDPAVASLHPATPHYLAGLRHYCTDELELAAAEFLEARRLASSEDNQRYFANYLQAVVESGRVVAAYQAAAAEDQTQILQYLLSEYEDEATLELSDEEIDSLVKAHRQQHPDDMLGWYWAGMRLEERGQDDDAVAMYRRAMQLEPDAPWRLENLKFRLKDLLMQSGKIAESLELPSSTDEEVVPDTEDEFVSVAWDLYNLCRWQELRTLIVDQQRERPQEDSTRCFQAVLAVKDGQFTAAAELIDDLKSSFEEDSDYELASVYYDLCAHPRLWEQAYARSVSDEHARELFAQIARRMSTATRLRDLKRLLMQHLARVPDDIRAADYDLQTAETGEELAAFAQRWRFLFDRSLGGDDDWVYQHVAENLAHVLLRLGRGEEALQLATRLQEECDASQCVILCHLQAGRLEQARAAIEQCAQDDAMYWLYEDDAVVRALCEHHFSLLPAAHPPELPGSVQHAETVLLLREQPQWTVKHVESCLQGISDSLVVSPIAGPDRQQYLIQLSDTRLLIAVHNTPRLMTDYTTPLLRAAELPGVDEHIAWVSVGVVQWGQPVPKVKALRQVRDVVLRLLDDTCSACWLVDDERLVANTADQRAALERVVTQIDFSELGEPANLYVKEATGSVEGSRQLSRALRRLRLAFDQRKGQEFAVAADLRAGEAVERLWISLEEIRSETDAGFVGRLLQDSQFVPELMAGQQVLYYQWELTGCRFEQAGQPVSVEVD